MLTLAPRPIATQAPLLGGERLPTETNTIPGFSTFHVPGQASAIRFFDPTSSDDYAALQDILRGKQTRRWMEGSMRLTPNDYREWSGTHDGTTYLFAVHDTRPRLIAERQRIRGFVYIYGEWEEKYRVKRMEKQGVLVPNATRKFSLEISFAARPDAVGQQSGSGLISSAARQACLQVLSLNQPLNASQGLIFAFVDEANIHSHHTLEASGFVNRGSMLYDWDSPEENYVYILDWRRLKAKFKEKLF